MPLPVAAKRSRRNGANTAGAIVPISSCFALRQNGSFRSLKIRSSRCRLLPEVDVAHLGLGLEDGAHQVREPLVERDDLLELVEDDHHAPLALGGQLAEQLEQPLDRVVDVGPAATDLEAEAQRAVARVDLDRRPDAQAAEELGRTLERLTDGRGDVGVDRLRQRRRQALLRRRHHQVAVADQHLPTHRLLCSAQHQRRLAVPAWGVDEHVLPVAHVGDELAELVLPVGEGFVEGEVAEGEGIGGVLIHKGIMASEIEIRVSLRTAPDMAESHYVD